MGAKEVKKKSKIEEVLLCHSTVADYAAVNSLCSVVKEYIMHSPFASSNYLPFHSQHFLNYISNFAC